jgi:2-polyprenyl-3-methyl-5-hydroxy-6-metoxy-1,4-benzoquinol methylase
LDPRYGERYRELYNRHWWWRSRAKFVEEKIRQLCPPTQAILDVGCGDALFFDVLSQLGEVEGVEPTQDLVSPDNPHRPKIHVCEFDDDFQPGKLFSLILMLDVLEHLSNPAAALRHAVNLLRPGGLLLATVPAFMSLWTNHDVMNHHVTRYTKRSFQQLANQTGLLILEQRYFYHWTSPLKFLAGIAERALQLPPNPPRVPPAFINEPLYWWSRLEQISLTRLPMPFGSSLMVIGSRKM